MSLTITAPAPRAARATSGFRVSIEMGTRTPAARIAATTGSTRSISSAADTSRAPGRVDSPPTSITPAPSATIAAARRAAASGSA